MKLTTALSLLLGLLLLTGCARDAEDENAVRDTVERGPLKLTVRVTPPGIAVGDNVTVTLEMRAPEGYAVEFPTPDAFGDVPARSLEASGPLPWQSGVIWRAAYELTPLLSGELKIPPLAAIYQPPSADTETQPAYAQELVSNPLKVQVASVLTAEDEPTAPRDISGPLLPPTPPMPLWQKLAIVGGGLVAVALGYFAYRVWRRHASRPPPPVAPEVWALQALAELADPGWFEAQRLREFTYRVTEILRAYIERKFGLAAPEMTTEEFLTALSRQRRSLPYDAERLREFLVSCDYIKYAALQPRREDAENMLATARAFVHATAAAEAAWSTEAREGQAA